MRVIIRHPRRTEAAEVLVFVPQRQLTVTAIGVSLLCGYEIAAIATGKVPTLSMVFRRHRVVEAVFLGWLITHLHVKVREGGRG